MSIHKSRNSYKLTAGVPIKDPKLATAIAHRQLDLILEKLKELSPEAYGTINQENDGKPLEIRLDFDAMRLGYFTHAQLRVHSPLVLEWLEAALMALDGEAENERFFYSGCLPLLLRLIEEWPPPREKLLEQKSP